MHPPAPQVLPARQPDSPTVAGCSLACWDQNTPCLLPHTALCHWAVQAPTPGCHQGVTRVTPAGHTPVQRVAVITPHDFPVVPLRGQAAPCFDPCFRLAFGFGLGQLWVNKPVHQLPSYAGHTPFLFQPLGCNCTSCSNSTGATHWHVRSTQHTLDWHTGVAQQPQLCCCTPDPASSAPAAAAAGWWEAAPAATAAPVAGSAS